MDSKGVIETIQDSFLGVVDKTVAYAPKVLVALLLVIVGVVVAGFVSNLLGRLIAFVENNDSVNKTAKKLNVKVVSVSDFVTLITKWTVLLIFINAAVDALGVSVLSDTFNKMLGFLPNIFAAAVIAAISIVAGNVIKDVVQVSAKQAGVKAHSFISSAARIAVLIFGLPLAAAQLGLDLTIINNNITVIVAGIMLALGLSFGLGGKETAGKIVDDFYKSWKK